MSCAEIQPLLDAYLDGELDAARGLETERHVAQCPVCRDQLRQLQALHAALQSKALYYRASPALRERALAALGTTPTSNQHRSTGCWWRWPALAASVLLVAITASSGTYWLARTSTEEQIASEVIAGHVRSLMVASRVTDVASSDRHTVKPWFNGKLDFAPAVVDLTTEGFPLLGGRLDYLAGRPVAALVYRHRQHVINLFVWPSGSTDGGTRNVDQQGYHLVHWTQNGMSYWAVSDLNPQSLETFGQLVRAQTIPPVHKSDR